MSKDLHPKYYIYHFSIKTLIRYGTKDIKKKTVVCDSFATQAAISNPKEPAEVKANCHLFDQTKKYLEKEGLLDEDKQKLNDKIYPADDLVSNDLITSLVVMDFSDFETASDIIQYCSVFENGITLTFGKGEDATTITFVDFLKSNSMSKKGCVYYVNKDLYDGLNERVTLGLMNPLDENGKKTPQRTTLSKWYAYSGLVVSQCDILNSIDLKPEEVAVIADDKLEEECCIHSCITAVSDVFFIDQVKDLMEAVSKHLNNIKKDESEKHLRITLKHVQRCLKKITSIYNAVIDLTPSKQSEYKLIELIKTINNGNIFVTEFNCDEKKIKSINDFEFLKLTLQKWYDGLNESYKAGKTNDIYWMKITVNDYPHTINLFDGEGLMSDEFADEINKNLPENHLLFEDDDEENKNADKMKEYHSLQIRLPFVKGVIHQSNFKQFFIDNGITKIKGMTFDDVTKERNYDVSKLKLILTESQFKLSKFKNSLKNKMEPIDKTPIDTYWRMIKEYDYHIAISKREHSDSSLPTLNYQFISTLPLEKGVYEKVLTKDRTMKEKTLEKDKIGSNLYPESVEGKLYEANHDFYFNTSSFKETRRDTFATYKKNAMLGRFSVFGKRKFLSSDLLWFLYKVIEKPFPNSCWLNINKVYMPKAKICVSKTDGENYDGHVLLLRNPHYSRNEIGILKCALKDEQREKYFGKLTGVVMINPLSLTAERLGGADYDGDECVIVYQQEIVHPVVKELLEETEGNKFSLKDPLVQIPSVNATKSLFTYTEKIKCFANTFTNRVGLISNQAFFKTSKAYKSKNQADKNEVAFYTILGGLEIDAAKNGRRPYLPISKEKYDAGESFIKLKNDLKKSKKNNLKSTINFKAKDDAENESKEPVNEQEIKELDKNIQEVSAHKDESNVNYVASYADEHYRYNSKVEGINKYETNKKSSNGEAMRSIIVALAVYSDCKSILSESLQYRGYDHQQDLIFSFFERQLNNKTINVRELLETKISGIDDKKPWDLYCESEQKFHYLRNLKDKKKLVKDLYGAKVSDIYYNFEEDGYLNLFLSLLHRRYSEKRVEKRSEALQKSSNVFNEDRASITTQLNEKGIYKAALSPSAISDEQFAEMVKEIASLESKFIHKIEENDYQNHKGLSKELETLIKEHLKKQSISLDDITSVINVFNNKSVFDLFLEEIIKGIGKEDK